MAIKTYYGEELYFRDGSVMLSGELERCIRTLLTQNRGVGIIGGFYEPGVPLALVSKLTLDREQPDPNADRRALAHTSNPAPK